MNTSTIAVEVMVAHYWAMVAAGVCFAPAEYVLVSDSFTNVVSMTAKELAWFARL